MKKDFCVLKGSSEVTSGLVKETHVKGLLLTHAHGLDDNTGQLSPRAPENHTGHLHLHKSFEVKASLILGHHGLFVLDSDFQDFYSKD